MPSYCFPPLVCTATTWPCKRAQQSSRAHACDRTRCSFSPCVQQWVSVGSEVGADAHDETAHYEVEALCGRRLEVAWVGLSSPERAAGRCSVHAEQASSDQEGRCTRMPALLCTCSTPGRRQNGGEDCARASAPPRLLPGAEDPRPCRLRGHRFVFATVQQSLM